MSKFNEMDGTEYNERFVRGDTEFYDLVIEHLKEFFSPEAVAGRWGMTAEYARQRRLSLLPHVIDIGSGTGVLAELFHEAGIDASIQGYEPSELGKTRPRIPGEGYGLRGSPTPPGYVSVLYQSESLGMQDIPNERYKYYGGVVFILKAAHEIALSLGSKEAFGKELDRMTTQLEKKRYAVIGDVQFTKRIREDPEQYADVIAACRAIDDVRIGHSHPPEEFIDEYEIQRMLPGFKVLRHDVIPAQAIDTGLREQGIELDYSPREFYLITFEME